MAVDGSPRRLPDVSKVAEFIYYDPISNPKYVSLKRRKVASLAG